MCLLFQHYTPIGFKETQSLTLQRTPVPITPSQSRYRKRKKEKKRNTLIEPCALIPAFLFLSGHRSVFTVSADTLTLNGMSPVWTEIKRLHTHTHTHTHTHLIEMYCRSVRLWWSGHLTKSADLKTMLKSRQDTLTISCDLVLVILCLLFEHSFVVKSCEFV